MISQETKDRMEMEADNWITRSKADEDMKNAERARRRKQDGLFKLVCLGGLSVLLLWLVVELVKGW